MHWATFVILAVSYWAMIQLAFWIPELGLPKHEVGLIADALAPWILLGVGLILREIRKK